MSFNHKKAIKIAHISDLHFGFDLLDDRIQACKKSLEDFKPDLVVVTGDIVYLGSKNEFMQAKEFLESLPSKKVIVPGNHDVLDGYYLPKINPFKRLRMFHRYLPFEQDIRIGRLEILGLDSTTFYAIARGKVNLNEFDRFSKDKNTIKCVALHHHLIAIPGTGENQIIKNVDAVIASIIQHNVKYVFHGHRHKKMHFRLDSCDWDKNLSNPVDIFACGTTSSKRLRGGDPYNNYNRITINTSVKKNSFSYVNMIFKKSKKKFIPRDRGFKI